MERGDRGARSAAGLLPTLAGAPSLTSSSAPPRHSARAASIHVHARGRSAPAGHASDPRGPADPSRAPRAPPRAARADRGIGSTSASTSNHGPAGVHHHTQSNILVRSPNVYGQLGTAACASAVPAADTHDTAGDRGCCKRCLFCGAIAFDHGWSRAVSSSRSDLAATKDAKHDYVLMVQPLSRPDC